MTFLMQSVLFFNNLARYDPYHENSRTRFEKLILVIIRAIKRSNQILLGIKIACFVKRSRQQIVKLNKTEIPLLLNSKNGLSLWK